MEISFLRKVFVCIKCKLNSKQKKVLKKNRLSLDELFDILKEKVSEGKYKVLESEYGNEIPDSSDCDIFIMIDIGSKDQSELLAFLNDSINEIFKEIENGKY